LFTQHPQHTYIHRHTHAHTHIQATSDIHAHVYTVNVYYESLQLTSNMHKTQDNGLVDDVNAMHAYGRSSAPIAHELVYDINTPHDFGLRESKPRQCMPTGGALHL